MYLLLLFKAFLIHGAIPDIMLLGTVIPITKNKRNQLMTQRTTEALHYGYYNMDKILETNMLYSYVNVFSSSNLQFGLTKQFTTQCAFVTSNI